MKDLPKRKEIKQMESPIEQKLYKWFLEYGVYPELQYEIPPFRVDFALPEIKTVIECDGQEFHGSDEQIKRDKKRDAYLNTKGWQVKRYSGSRINQEPTEIVKEIIALYYPPRKVFEYYDICCGFGTDHCDVHTNEMKNRAYDLITRAELNKQVNLPSL